MRYGRKRRLSLSSSEKQNKTTTNKNQPVLSGHGKPSPKDTLKPPSLRQRFSLLGSQGYPTLLSALTPTLQCLALFSYTCLCFLQNNPLKINDQFGYLRPNPQFGNAVNRREPCPKEENGRKPGSSEDRLKDQRRWFCMHHACLL